MKSIFDIHDLQKALIKKGFALQLQASILIFVIHDYRIIHEPFWFQNG